MQMSLRYNITFVSKNLIHQVILMDKNYNYGKLVSNIKSNQRHFVMLSYKT